MPLRGTHAGKVLNPAGPACARDRSQGLAYARQVRYTRPSPRLPASLRFVSSLAIIPKWSTQASVDGPNGRWDLA